MRFRFIHAADVHLDSPLRGLRQYEGAPVAELSGATRQAFLRLVDLCLAERIDFLLLAGDLYDGDWEDYNTGLFFTGQMARLREAEIPVFLIRGNHDAKSRITRQLRLPDNVRAFDHERPETHELPELGVAVHGQSFATPAVTENLALGYPAARAGWFNIGLLHTSADGRPEHDNYAPCSLPDLFAREYQYWALGHVHAREVLAREPWVVFPGNLQGRHLREQGPKGCTLVTVDEHGEASLEHRALDVARWCRCEIEASSADTLEDLLARAAEALKLERATAEDRLLAAQLVFRGRCAAHRALLAEPERFAAEVRSLANGLGNLWIEQVKIETRSPLDLEAMLHQCDPLGDLVRHLRELPRDEAALQELGTELLSLKRKLPPELVRAILPDETAAVRAVLGEVEQLLVPRLVEGIAPA